MLLRWPSNRYAPVIVVVISALSVACNSGERSGRTLDAVDTSGLLDTLPAFRDVRGTSGDTAAQVSAAIDALQGEVGLPAPLVMKQYRREGESVLIDLVADSFPQLKWSNAGGTVRILSDGRRAIVARHK